MVQREQEFPVAIETWEMSERLKQRPDRFVRTSLLMRTNVSYQKRWFFNTYGSLILLLAS